MKKRLLGLVLFFIFQSIRSQVVFCPPGAQWTGVSRYWSGPQLIYEQAIYIGDSVIGDETAKIIQHPRFFINGCGYDYTPPYKLQTLIKQRGDTIFMRNCYTQHTWQILYNFAAMPGDMWINILSAPPTLSYYTTFVDSVSYVPINNFALKRLHVHHNFCGTGFNANYIQTVGTITERIGFSGHLFPYHFYLPGSGCEFNPYNGPLCYGDNQFGVTEFATGGCYFTGVQENDSHPFDVTLFPNPVLSELHLKCDFALHDENTYACFSDLHGREIRRIPLTPEMNTIDFRDVSNGMYIVSIIRNRQVVYKTKIVKEQ